jgi:hypothetical protein
MPADRKGVEMPEEKHLGGVGEKEQLRYEHIEEAGKEGRYRGREKEVAARTVLRRHRERGTAKAGKRQ